MAMLAGVKSLFVAKGIHVLDEWVEQCLEFLQQEYGTQNVNQLKDKAYDQWLHTDLTELGSCSLPMGLNNLKCTHLKGRYILQINKIHDIGSSSYKQLQKLKKEENGNVEVSAENKFQASWQPKSSRVLLLEMTDGTSIVSGMEYKPMPSISLSIAPGSKICVAGDIEVRRGILLLTENHVQNLGGKVESLSTSHAQDNVLRRALGLEETDNPLEFKGTSLQPVEIKTDVISGWTTSQKPLQPIKTERGRLTSSHSNSRGMNIPPRPTVIEDDFDDFFDGDVEMALMEAEGGQFNIKEENMSSSLRDGSKIKASTNPKNASIFNNAPEFFPKMSKSTASFSAPSLPKMSSDRHKTQCKTFNNNFKSKIKTERNNIFSNSNSSDNNKPIIDEIINIDDSDDEALLLAAGDFDDMIDHGAKSPTSQLPKKFIKLDTEEHFSSLPRHSISTFTKSSLPFQYLISMPETVYKKIIYTIKGFVMTLTSTLKQEDGNHVLTVLLNDGTGTCDANIHDDVIRGMLGLTATELSKQISKSREDPSLRPAITEKLSNFQKCLISMCCIFKLELSPFVKRPTVMEILPLDSTHLNQLKNRLEGIP